ncbi:SUF system Fe-S cluster assembly regulator [bacterium]|nr:SUF system Fe-S cluster assembly regulator [bacterium]
MIRLTKITDYAIVLLCQMATQGQETTHNARDLAGLTRLPLPMVSKILKALARGGILASHRGTKGGFRLIRPASQIRISEIIQALEGPIAITECLTDQARCGVGTHCPLRISWNRINEAIQGALDGITLAEMFQPTRGPELIRLAETASMPIDKTTEPTLGASGRANG